MEVKSKLKVVAFAIAMGFFAIALLLFFIAPIAVEGVGAVYSGATAFASGAKTLFSFAFDVGKYLIFFIFVCLFLFCFIWWMIVILIRRSWKSFYWFGFSLGLTLVSSFALCGLIVTVDGSESVLKQVFAIDGAVVGKGLVAGVIAFMFFGVMFMTLCAYTDILQAFEARASERSAEEEEIRALAKEEAEKAIKESQNRRIEYIIAEESSMSKYSNELNVKRSSTSDDEYYNRLINELPMFRGHVHQEPKPQPKPAPKAEPKPAPVAPAPAPVVAPAPAPVAKKEAVEFERISFTERLLKSDKVVKQHYNELKSEILSYGIKSRVSNSGDTFRLHTKTYVKLVVAGKGLKLYYALDPKDYADSTLPIQDASKKSLYKDIPLVFKVKSDLSVRRAKQLVADAAAKDGLVQGEVVAHDWVKELK